MSVHLIGLLVATVLLDDLREAMRSLGFTQSQSAELSTEPERAFGWVEWARSQPHLQKPAAVILNRFRSGEEAPDPNAWRGAGELPAGPNYPALLKASEALVRTTGHEFFFDFGAEHERGWVFLQADLVDELERFGQSSRVGNGAVLTDVDRERLLRTALLMCERQVAAEREERARDRERSAGYYAGLLAKRTITPEHLHRLCENEQLTYWGPGFEEEVREKAQLLLRAALRKADRSAEEPAFLGEEP